MYSDALKYLNGLTVFGIKPGLERIEETRDWHEWQGLGERDAGGDFKG